VSITAQQAHTIFAGSVFGQPEALTALEALQPEEREAYEQIVERFQESLVEHSVKAQTEMGKIVADHGLLAKPSIREDWSIQDFRDVMDAIEGSEYEQVHLLATFNLNTTKPLLDLVKP
jgi:hypothetical protein